MRRDQGAARAGPRAPSLLGPALNSLHFFERKRKESVPVNDDALLQLETVGLGLCRAIRDGKGFGNFSMPSDSTHHLSS